MAVSPSAITAAVFEVGEELSDVTLAEEYSEGCVVCVRYWVALGVISLVTLSMDPLPR